MRNYKDFKEYHIEQLKDPTEAGEYLKLALSDYEKEEDFEDFLLALRDVAEAQAQLGRLTQEIILDQQELYKALTEEEVPQLSTVSALLQTLGYRLSIEPLQDL